MATTWKPITAPERTWLLANGQTVEYPAMEQTQTGRKVRIAGTNDTRWSEYATNRDQLAWRWITHHAQRAKTEPWMPPFIEGSSASHWNHRNPQLHFMREDANHASPWRGTTTVWWRFKHPTLPIAATVSVTMTGGNYGRASEQSISGRFLTPLTQTGQMYTRWAEVQDEAMPTWLAPSNYTYDTDHLAALGKLLTNEPPGWGLTSTLTNQQLPDVRTATTEFLRRVRVIDDIAQLRIPDLRNPSKPSYLVLELVDSNVTGEFIESLVSFLDAAPKMSAAVEAYKAFTKALRDVGLVLEDLGENELLAALHVGANAITVNAGSPHSATGLDQEHNVTLRLATGTFVVSCSVRGQKEAGNKDTIATKWEEAQAMASITGQEDELLAYARQYALHSEKKRAAATLAARV